jgi:5-methylcytosine-specific restriction endonuclease McrA
MKRGKNDYTVNWNEVARKEKERAGWKCVRCGEANDASTGHVLTVHHLDMDKSNNEWWNLAALCQKCHLTIQSKVDMAQGFMFDHTPWFKPYVAGYYASHYGFLGHSDRAWVEQNLDALLELGKQGAKNGRVSYGVKGE